MPYDQFKNVFVAENGNLTSKETLRTVRERYSYTFRDIKNTHQLRATLRNGKYTDVGGYPLYLVFADGEACCFDCAKKDYKTISYDMHSEANKEVWSIVACDVNWEDESLYCGHCGKQIESAYESDDD